MMDLGDPLKFLGIRLTRKKSTSQPQIAKKRPTSLILPPKSMHMNLNPITSAPIQPIEKSTSYNDIKNLLTKFMNKNKNERIAIRSRRKLNSNSTSESDSDDDDDSTDDNNDEHNNVEEYTKNDNNNNDEKQQQPIPLPIITKIRRPLSLPTQKHQQQQQESHQQQQESQQQQQQRIVKADKQKYMKKPRLTRNYQKQRSFSNKQSTESSIDALKPSVPLQPTLENEHIEHKCDDKDVLMDNNTDRHLVSGLCTSNGGIANNSSNESIVKNRINRKTISKKYKMINMSKNVLRKMKGPILTVAGSVGVYMLTESYKAFFTSTPTMVVSSFLYSTINTFATGMIQ